MKVEVRLFANLRDFMAKDKRGLDIIELDNSGTVEDLLQTLKIPEDNPLIIMVNGKRELNNIRLKEGDRIGIFPPIGGG